MKAACFLFASAQAANYAVLVAGSNSYGNYRHQADVAHAYQIMKAHGIPEDNIITFMYDDIAESESNPFKGKIFNKPTDKGTPGVDVYAGVKIDYKGDAVTSKNFLNALTGTGSAGPVLKSTGEDNVFINFVDHGGAGIIAFPSGILAKDDLQNALKEMKTKTMYKQLVFYLEACESGSMFDDFPADQDVYITTASNPTESSWGTYCGQEGYGSSSVDGKNLGTCLGDLYSVNWMEDTDSKGVSETLLTQYDAVKLATNRSAVMQYGDTKDFNPLPLKDFFGAKAALSAAAFPSAAEKHASSMDIRDIELYTYYNLYLSAPAERRGVAAKELMKEIENRENSEAAFLALVALAYPHDEAKRAAAFADRHPVRNQPCALAVHYAMAACEGFTAHSGYALQFQRVAVNLCADAALAWSPAQAAAAAKQACTSTHAAEPATLMI